MDDDYAGCFKEAEILEKLAENLDDYFHLLVNQYKDSIFRMAYNILHRKPEDAEEVTWDTFAQAYQALSKMIAEEQDIRLRIRLKPWLFRITRNRCFNRCRDDAPSVPLNTNEEGDLVEDTPDSPSAEDEAIRREKDYELYNILWKLSEQDYEIIRLYYFKGHSDAEIAEKLKKKPDAIKKARQRALKKLRDMMSGDEKW